jgi:phospholipase/carboxylesterase
MRERKTMRDVTGGTGPHAGRPIATAGARPGDAAGALILVHGRGGDAEEMLGLAELVAPATLACLAPQAVGSTWYPYRFTEPVALIGDTVASPPAGARTFEGMPVLLGCSEHDPHIPIARVRETEAVMRGLGAEVVARIYPGGGHGINEDEVAIARRILARIAGATPPA